MSEKYKKTYKYLNYVEHLLTLVCFIVLLEKDKLNTIEVLISKTLIDTYISHDEFVSVNNVLR